MGPQVMKKWSRAKQLIKNRFAPHALILMYHRITSLENDPYLLAVTPEHFADQLEVIRECTSPISLRQLKQALMERRFPNRAVVITFDDGYADNLHNAKPLLERYEIPATVFVASGKVGKPYEFWWDELDRLVLQPGSLPPQLKLGSNGPTREWSLGEAATYSNSDYMRHKHWHVECENIPTDRHRLFQDLYNWLQAATEADKWCILEELAAQSGAEPTGRDSHRALTAQELRILAGGGLIEIGAHTMSHPLLASLPVGEQRNQIQRSKEILDEILKVFVTSFAYPHGSYTQETITILRESGFICACTSDPSAVWQNASSFELPRLGVRDWDQNTFKRWLRWWMDG